MDNDTEVSPGEKKKCAVSSMLPSRKVVLGVPMVVMVGLCFNTYHLCTAQGIDIAQGHPLSGVCTSTSASAVAVDVFPTTAAAGTMPPPSTNNAGGHSPPKSMWPLLELIVTTVERSVWGYFITFILCWNAILAAMVIMIDRYITFLGLLVQTLSAWPMNLIAVLGMGIALGGAALILNIVMGYLFPKNRFGGTTMVKKKGEEDA